MASPSQSPRRTGWLLRILAVLVIASTVVAVVRSLQPLAELSAAPAPAAAASRTPEARAGDGTPPLRPEPAVSSPQWAPARPVIAPATVLPGHDAPTLGPEERAQLEAMLKSPSALDAQGRAELEAMLFQDTLQRLLALRASGEGAGERAALLRALRAGLPVREAAGDLPPGLLQRARDALAEAGAQVPR